MLMILEGIARHMNKSDHLRELIAGVPEDVIAHLVCLVKPAVGIVAAAAVMMWH